MDFEEAKKYMIEKYSELGFKIIDVTDDGAIIENNNITYSLNSDDIQKYSELYDFLNSLEIKPNECSICNSSFREQAIGPLDRMGMSLHRLRHLGPFTFGDESSIHPIITIGEASPIFSYYFRFDADFIKYATRVRYSDQDESGKLRDIRSLNSRLPPTIQINSINKNSVDDAINYSEEIIEDCFFQIAYLKKIPLQSINEWRYNRINNRERVFQTRKINNENKFRFLTARYNPDIIKFYQLGISSSESVLQFLSLYLVLEYFFIGISDEKLYNQMTLKLNNPSFRTDQSHLDKIIQIIEEHKKITDEKMMLKNVLEKFVDEDELIEIIRKYDKHLGDKKYSKKQDIFGESLEVKVVKGHVFGNISSRIKAVRNALVHSSDRYDRKPRHIPFSESTEIVKREIPLLKYLAEEVIISSASTRE